MFITFSPKISSYNFLCRPLITIAFTCYTLIFFIYLCLCAFNGWQKLPAVAEKDVVDITLKIVSIYKVICI